MIIRQVKSLVGGETLAEPVITKEKEILISGGTVLKPEYLDLISFLGIDTVCIEDPYEAFETTHLIINEEREKYYVSEVQKILENHIYHGKNSLSKMAELANEIVSEITKAEQPKVIDIEERNGNLYEHTVQVSLAVAKMLKVKEEDYIDIAIGALLHDLGMRYTTVPYINFDMDSRPASEVFELKKHTILAYSALEGEDWISPVSKKMVLTHHERKDGSGYPLKQKTKDIECNILQVYDFRNGM